MRTIDLRNSYRPTAKQLIAHTAPEKYILFGGAIRGGKTVWLCMSALKLSLKYPSNIGYLCRHELTSFRRTTQITFEKLIPSELISPPLGQHHRTENFYRLPNGSLIFYGGLGDDEKGLNRLKSMELGWFGVDQAEETSESHFLFLASRLSLNIPNIIYKGLLTANPAPGWVKYRFIEQGLPNHKFIPALPRDNIDSITGKSNLPPNYEDELRELYPEELIKQLLDGDWEALESGNYLFRYSDIRSAIGREIESNSHAITMGVDIARFGDDSTVVIPRQGQRVIRIERWAKTDLMETARRIAELIDSVKPSIVNIDIIGLGAGVYDRLRELKYKNIIGVNVAEASRDKDKFANLRAELYWNLYKRFEARNISIPDDLELITQLSGIKCKYPEGRLQIESKEDMKKRGMKSPDKADALALAFYEPKISSRPLWFIEV